MKILRVISSVNPKEGGPIEGIKQDFKYSNHHKINQESGSGEFYSGDGVALEEMIRRQGTHD